MIKKIDIAGIQLDNYTVREAIAEIDKSFQYHVMYTVEEISMDLMLMAESDEQLRNVIAGLNQTVIADRGILEAVHQDSMQRKREIDDHIFFFELLRRCERNHKKVFLLGENRGDVQQMQELMLQEYPRLEFVGTISLEECIGTEDTIVNEMNVAAPDIIISILPSPRQENFLSEHHDKLSAQLWYGKGSERPVKKRWHLADFFGKRIRMRQLSKWIRHYGQKE